MIRRFDDYETTPVYGDYEQLPKGAYVLQAMQCDVCENSTGQYLKIAFDVAEGEYKGYFANEYRNQQSQDKKWHCNFLVNVPKNDGTEQDGWTKRRFKTIISNFEKSNPNTKFNWDERWFKGKLIGGLFNFRAYRKNDGNIGEAINCAQLIAVEKVRSGDYKLPEDKPLNKNTNNKYSSGGGVYNPYCNQSQADSSGFMNIPDGVEDDDLPFN